MANKTVWRVYGVSVSKNIITNQGFMTMLDDSDLEHGIYVNSKTLDKRMEV